MGLYLCVFENDDERDGVDVGSYADFEFFRECVTATLENGRAGSRFPMLIEHSDCDGEWSPTECGKLREELLAIASGLRQLPATEFHSEWQQRLARSIGLVPTTLFECFIDVDGENLVERLIELSDIAIEIAEPIVFQ